jgi:Fe-S oxidoreductase
MCPSHRVTGREEDSPRGRARALQELANGSLIGAFSDPAMAAALELCLGCKACSSECPAGVDVARAKSEVLYRRYRHRPRPRAHYALGWLPRWTRLAARAPGLANAIIHGALAGLVRHLAGLAPQRSLPQFAPQSFRRGLPRRPDLKPAATGLDPATPWTALPGWDGGSLAAVGRPGRPSCGPAPETILRSGADDADDLSGPPVVLWADSFSDSLAPGIPAAAARVLSDAGYAVFIAPDTACCALTWITTGQLDAAKARLSQLMGVLGPFAVAGIPIVGIEPACLAVLRHDAPDLLPQDRRAVAVAAQAMTLAELLTAPPPTGPTQWRPPDLTGRRIIVQPHCHQAATIGFEADRALLRATGAELVELVGCCGMAGDFGMTPSHYAMSVAVAEASLLPALRAAGPDALLLADGFSCRAQATDLAGVSGLHLAELLAGR